MGLLLVGQQETFSEITWDVFALPFLAPLTLVFSLSASQAPPIHLRLLRMALILAPLIAAVILARLQAGPLEF